MNTALVTTGLTPLVIGSVERFQLQAYLNALPWLLDGGTVLLTISDPFGVQTIIVASIIGNGAQATWTVVGPAGNFTRAWTVTDANGVKQKSRPIVFSVTASP